MLGSRTGDTLDLLADFRALFDNESIRKLIPRTLLLFSDAMLDGR